MKMARSCVYVFLASRLFSAHYENPFFFFYCNLHYKASTVNKKYVVNKEKQSMLCTCLCKSGRAGSREKPGHCLFLSLYNPPLHLFVLYLTSAGICQVRFSLKVPLLWWYLCFRTCNSSSHLHCNNLNVPNTVPVLRRGGGCGVSGHMQKLQELEQDGSPFTVMGGSHGWGCGQRSDFHCSMVSCLGPLSSHFTFPYLTAPPGTDSALYL